MGRTSTRNDLNHDPHDQSNLSIGSSSNRVVYYPQRQLYSRGHADPHTSRPVMPVQRTGERASYMIPPLSLEPTSSFTASFGDGPISPIPSTSLKRCSHIRRKERPKRLSKVHIPPRIITDFSRPLSQESTPPLSATPSTPSQTPIPENHSVQPPSPDRTPIRQGSPERTNSGWPDSPGSIYSTLSARGNSISMDWDTTGYLQPEGTNITSFDPDTWPEPEDEGGLAGLKRQKTAVVVQLLQERRRRAGMD